MNTIIGIVSILLFHGIWNDEHVVICSIFIIINQIILLVGKYSTWWFYFYYSLILSLSTHLFPILFNNIIYQSTLLSAILILLSIWIILSKSILISNIISNTSYSMKYDINIDKIVLTTIIYSINSWFAPD